jgi:hypothetical protein
MIANLYCHVCIVNSKNGHVVSKDCFINSINTNSNATELVTQIKTIYYLSLMILLSLHHDLSGHRIPRSHNNYTHDTKHCRVARPHIETTNTSRLLNSKLLTYIHVIPHRIHISFRISYQIYQLLLTRNKHKTNIARTK